MISAYLATFAFTAIVAFVAGVFYGTRSSVIDPGSPDYLIDSYVENNADASRLDFLTYVGGDVIFNEATDKYAVLDAAGQTIGRGVDAREAIDNARYSATRSIRTRGEA